MEIHNIYGDVIYTSKKEKIKEALEEAVKNGANLREANLREANLREANLSEADLSEADLSGSNLREANLSEANLREANLREADLRGANLSEANLRGANLRGANLREADLREAIISIYCKWPITIIDGNIKIGCKTNSIEGWDAFFASDKHFSTERNTPDFIRIEANYLAAKAYLQHLNTHNHAKTTI